MKRRKEKAMSDSRKVFTREEALRLFAEYVNRNEDTVELAGYSFMPYSVLAISDEVLRDAFAEWLAYQDFDIDRPNSSADTQQRETHKLMSEAEAVREFERYIDGIHLPIVVCGDVYRPSSILRAANELKFHIEYKLWLTSNNVVIKHNQNFK